MQKPFAVNDFIINDRSSFEGLSRLNCTILSLLRGGIGLPRANVQLAQRYGRWPFASGLGRPGTRYLLTTHFLKSTPALRYDQRRDMLAEINPELEIPFRLLVADEIAPEGLLVAFGPWDVYADDADAWHCRELLWTDSETVRVEADITGTVHFEDGQQSRQRAIVIEEAMTNLVINPSFETNSTNWAATAGAAIARVTTEQKFGFTSLEANTTGVGAFEGCTYTAGALAGSTTYTGTAWVKIPSGTAMRLRMTDGVTSTDTTFTSTGAWERIEVEKTFAAVPVSTVLNIATTGASDVTFYVDGVQVEASDYATTYTDGSLGPGYAWSGTAHGSTSTRTATVFDLDDEASLISEQDTLTFRVVAQMPYDHDGDWPNTTNYLWSIIGIDNNNHINLNYTTTDDKFNIYINGGIRLASSVQNFDAGDWVDIVATIDFTNDSHALYINGVLEDTDATALSTPVLTTWKLGSFHDGTFQANAFYSEYDVWDRALDANEIAAVYANGTVAGRARYVNALCEFSGPLEMGGTPTNRGETSNLANDEDVRWRSRDGDVAFWSIYDDTWSADIEIDSDDDVWPELRLTPGTAKDAGTGFQYKVFCRTEWSAPSTAVKYPMVYIMDTATPIPAKMKSLGEDLRVFVNGSEVDRWLNDIDTATTEIWINLDFAPTVSVTLGVAIGAGDTVTEVEATDGDDISDFPEQGILLIDSEEFYYTSKNNTDLKFLGVTRAVRGTAAAAHTTADTIYWIQHDVIIVYGDSTLSAPTVDDENEPAFALSSSNTSWDYDDFGENARKRAAQWVQEVVTDPGTFLETDSEFKFTTANNWTQADPWSEIGIKNKFYSGGPSGPAALTSGSARWKVNNVCGITNANFTNGDTIIQETDWSAALLSCQSSEDGSTWIQESEITTDPWTLNQALDVNGADKWVALFSSLSQSQAIGDDTNVNADIECSDCTLTIYAAQAPVTTVGSERANYSLDVTITNTTTDEAIILDFPVMEIDEILVVDTYEQTIKYLQDGASQQQALTLVGGARRDWFRLIRGTNALTWSDTGTAEVDVDILWHRREME